MTQVVTEADHRSNNFDFLRLVGALAVIVGHAYPLLARSEQAPIIWGYPLQTIGVIIFFSISGYLITASWSRNHNPVAYVVARGLRILPALIVVVLVTALVLGPMVTTLSREDYFASPVTLDYITNNLRLFVQFGLPGVWEDLPLPGAVNGSLWTLFVEVVCYVVVPLLFLVPRRLRPLGALLVVFWVIALAETPQEESPIYWAVRVRDAAGLAVYFAGGAFLRMASQGIGFGRRLTFRGDVAIALIAVYTLVAAAYPQYALKIGWLVIPYAVLTIGLARTPYICRTARFGDFSYGLYLWAFPVQQTIIHLWGPQRLFVDLLLVTSITLLLAVISWYLVESPALRLKEWVLPALTRRPKPQPAPEPKVAAGATPAEIHGGTPPGS